MDLTCSKCGGTGRVFFYIGRDERREIACPDCGLDGGKADTLYRMMVDPEREAQRRALANTLTDRYGRRRPAPQTPP